MYIFIRGFFFIVIPRKVRYLRKGHFKILSSQIAFEDHVISIGFSYTLRPCTGKFRVNAKTQLSLIFRK